ncbi:MAG: DUF1365 domain-containing protein [Pusillimonas sp.]|nr:DUF1365 domain-containing protein [Pusillimonas sp.]
MKLIESSAKLTNTLSAGALPLIGTGQIRHARLRPVEHVFSYRTWFLMVPMRSSQTGGWGGLARNKTALVAFHDKDHGNGGPDALAWFDALLRESGVHDADGEVWLQTYPRVLGYVFKPVSFWYAYNQKGNLRAILAEVNNTFGERHCYLLASSVQWGKEMVADKVFHVSPFCRASGRYRFRFMRTDNTSSHGARIVARIDHDDAAGQVILQTSVSGRLQPFSRMALWKVMMSMPFLTFGIIARIHWQALRLWLKKVPFNRKPPLDQPFVTEGDDNHTSYPRSSES